VGFLSKEATDMKRTVVVECSWQEFPGDNGQRAYVCADDPRYHIYSRPVEMKLDSEGGRIWRDIIYHAVVKHRV
jgi:hypothetical protein